MAQKGYAVSFEKKVTLPNNRNYVIDIYAERDKDIVLIECGWCPLQKLSELRKHYKTIHVPSMKCYLPTTPYDPLEGKHHLLYPAV